MYVQTILFLLNSREFPPSREEIISLLVSKTVFFYVLYLGLAAVVIFKSRLFFRAAASCLRPFIVMEVDLAR